MWPMGDRGSLKMLVSQGFHGFYRVVLSVLVSSCSTIRRVEQVSGWCWIVGVCRVGRLRA